MEPLTAPTEFDGRCDMGLSIGQLSSSFSQLPDIFFARQVPSPVAAPALVIYNHTLAAALGLDTAGLSPAALAAIFSGNILPAGAVPIAMAYAGHQFGHFVPQLGDGRAILLGEVIDIAGGRRDIQLKGAGRTAYSRGGDGRAALGPVLREYLLSEAMHALGIPTTRALAAVTTGERVIRETYLPGAVLTRVTASNIRVGSFQFFAARGDQAAIKQLADYVIDRHYPAARDAANRYAALLELVVERQAMLIARWLNVGFIHGVMNTDNMAVSGETIDYGPCAFMDSYDPATVFSSIDERGRYAYGNQASIAQWNLTRFAETLLPLLDPDETRGIERATAIIMGFSGRCAAARLAGMRAKLGLRTAEDGDPGLIQSLLDAMQQNKVDFTIFFRRLSDEGNVPSTASGVRELFGNPEAYDHWARLWHQRLTRETSDLTLRASAMRAVNPAFIPRNHIVEQVLAAAIEQADFTPFHELLRVLQHPFTDQPGFARYSEAPLPGQSVLRTYCGT